MVWHSKYKVYRCKCCRILDYKAMEREYGWDVNSGMCCKCRDIIPEYIPETQYRKYIRRHKKLHGLEKG